MLKADKERVIAELVERLRTSDTLILADYRGLSMKEIDGLRTELLKHGARFSVVKNTLTRRAAETAGVEELKEFLEGPTAIAFVAEGDMIAVAKALSDTARRTRILDLKGGILQGRPVTGDQVRDLAALPPTDVLRGQVIGAVVGPLNAIVGLFTAPIRDFVGIVDARIRQLGEAEGATAASPEEPEASADEAVAADAPADQAEASPDEPEASAKDAAAAEATPEEPEASPEEPEASAEEAGAGAPSPEDNQTEEQEE
jgi:large subunit ribosomal protein L10